MSDVKGLLQPLDSIEPPDEWDRISRGAAGSKESSLRRPLRFVAALAAAFLITAGVVALLMSALSSSSTHPDVATEPTTPISSPVVERIALGDPVRLGIGPNGGLASMVEAFGSAWVIGQFHTPESGEVQLRRLDPRDGTIQAEFNLPIAGGGEWGGDGLVVGGGYLWGTAWGSATIFRIDPIDDSVSRFHLDGAVVENVAFDQQAGELWATVAGEGEEDSVLTRLDPGDGSVVSSTPFTSGWSSGLMSVRGSVWVLERDVLDDTVSGGRLRQLLPGDAPDFETGGSFALPVTDGRWIWTPMSGDGGVMNLSSAIAQVDPSDGSVVQRWDVGGVGYDLAVGPDGGIWYLGPGGLSRLNPRSGEIQAWEASTDRDIPTFVAPSSGGMWVGGSQGALSYWPFVP
jgi:hypothetical protein